MEGGEGLEPFEFVFEGLAGEEDAALDRAQGDGEGVGDLVVAVAADVHGEGDAQFVVELADGFGDFLQAAGAFGGLDA